MNVPKETSKKHKISLNFFNETKKIQSSPYFFNNFLQFRGGRGPDLKAFDK